MMTNLDPLTGRLAAALENIDRQTAAALCEQLIQLLYFSQEEIATNDLEHILDLLRDKRQFLLTQRVAEAFIQMGHQTYNIRRQYAQSLVDQGIYAAPLAILQNILAETEPDADTNEHAETAGLIGRVYKQQYIDAAQPGNPQIAYLLDQAIQYYWEAYNDNASTHLWHGINCVALLHRSLQDGIGANHLPDPDPIAKDILAVIEEMEHPSPWDLATACEACLALHRPEKALEWMERYTTSAAGAFQLAGTLRQLQQVWRFTMDHPAGRLILPLLQAALLEREGATLTIDTSQLAGQQSPTYSMQLEKVLGTASFRTYQWYVRGLKACTAVARIGRDSSQGIGTGFLVDGALLSPEWQNKMVLFTNAHVISDNAALNNGSLYPEQAVAVLEAVDRTIELRFGKIIYTSPFYELDTTILSFDTPSEEKLNALRPHICLYPLAKRLPEADRKQRVYIIGYPRGGTLQVSLQDNILLAHDHRLIHYRTPTEGGNSGSPVFNDEWELIGIHHAGGERMRPLDGSKTPYPANEGICISAILNRVIFP